MYRNIPFLLTLGLLLLTCSDKPSEPSDQPSDLSMNIAYELDTGQRISSVVSSANGGLMTTTDAHGVEFALSIPPLALPSETAITITPFSWLTLDGPGGSSCSGCNPTDSMCCFRGVWLEPDGLILDSPITLAIQFPQDAFPFEYGALIVCFDSANGKYEICPTQLDTAACRLTAQISHFSGYGTDEARYDRIEAEIYEAAEELASRIGSPLFYSALNPLKTLHFVCAGHGNPELAYPDLLQSIETVILQAYQQQANAIRDQFVGSRTCDALYQIDLCHRNMDFPAPEWTNANDFSNLKTALASDLEAEVLSVAEYGHALCETDSCSSGRHKLECAFEFSEDPLSTQIIQWLEECCEVSVSLVLDKSLLNRIALTEGNTGDCFTPVLVEVSEGMDQPIANTSVSVEWDASAVGLAGGQTDENGKFSFVLSSISLTESDFSCGRYVERNLRAKVRVHDETYYSDWVPVVFANLLISAAVSYNYEYQFSNGTDTDVQITIVGGGTGTGTSYSSCPNSCEGMITRFYYSSGGGSTSAIIGNQEIPGCLAYPQYITHQVNDSVYVKLLTAIRLHDPCRMLQDVIMEECDSTGACDTLTTDLCRSDWATCVKWPPICLEDGYHFTFPNLGGSFDTYIWEYNDQNKSALLSISVVAGY